MATSSTYSGGGSSAKGTSAGSAGSGGSSSGGGGGGGMSGAEKRAISRENAAKRKAAEKYRSQAATLQLQANALKANLSSGFLKALNARLANVNLVSGQQDAALVEGYNSRVGDLKGAAKDNEKASSATTFANLANRGRERASALSEAMNNGAGESDVLRSQMMSLRNWSANQSESNRASFDGLRSINSSLGDLNADTKTARLNAETQKNNDIDQLYTQYFNQKSEGYTQLGNVYGQQAELYGLAKEQGSGKSGKDQKSKSKESGKQFTYGANYASMVHKNPGNSQALRDWKGTDDFEGSTNSSMFENAATNIGPAKKPEGATLRKWTA